MEQQPVPEVFVHGVQAVPFHSTLHIYLKLDVQFNQKGNARLLDMIYLQMGLHVQDSDTGTEPMETPVDDCEERSKEYKQEPTKTMNHYMQRGGQSWTITIKR